MPYYSKAITHHAIESAHPTFIHPGETSVCVATSPSISFNSALE